MPSLAVLLAIFLVGSNTATSSPSESPDFRLTADGMVFLGYFTPVTEPGAVAILTIEALDTPVPIPYRETKSKKPPNAPEGQMVSLLTLRVDALLAGAMPDVVTACGGAYAHVYNGEPLISQPCGSSDAGSVLLKPGLRILTAIQPNPMRNGSYLSELLRDTWTFVGDFWVVTGPLDHTDQQVKRCRGIKNDVDRTKTYTDDDLAGLIATATPELVDADTTLAEAKASLIQGYVERKDLYLRAMEWRQEQEAVGNGP